MIHPNNNEKFYFEIYKDEYDYSTSNDLFYFKLKDEDGNSYIRSRPHIHKTNCLKELKSVLRNSKNRERFIIEQPFDNTWRVYLKAGNGEKIANSPCFGTEEEAKNFIEDLKSLTLETPVVDKTE